MKRLFPKPATIGLLAITLLAPLQLAAQPDTLSLEDAAAILMGSNNAIKSASTAAEVARAQKRQLNSTWYPNISVAGGYFHFSNEISVEADLGGAAQDLAQGLVQMIPQIEMLLPQLQQIVSSIAGKPLSLPVIKQDIATIDAVAIWPLITGGKRIYASKIGRGLEATAQQMKKLAENAQTALMLNAYYTLKLSGETISMQHENLKFCKHLHFNATRLFQEGFINKAEFLIAEVALKEAEREYETSISQESVALNALGTVLGKRLQQVELSGRFFSIDSLPDIYSMNEEILQENAALGILRTQQEILHSQEMIAKGDFFPDIALFAKQNIHSWNLPKNLSPRTTIGAAMQWEIFNGTARENNIKERRLQQEQMGYTIAQTEQELITAALALRSRMVDALYNINTLEQACSLARELLKEREKGFAEGMATPTDVVAARASLTKASTALNLARWEYCTSLANLLALSCNTEKFIELHNEN
jgi:outer membrane protein TolC